MKGLIALVQANPTDKVGEDGYVDIAKIDKARIEYVELHFSKNEVQEFYRDGEMIRTVINNRMYHLMYDRDLYQELVNLKK